MKLGRPLDGKIKDIDVKVRIDSDLNDELLEFCEKNNKKRAEAIRLAIKLFLKNKKDLSTGKWIQSPFQPRLLSMDNIS